MGSRKKNRTSAEASAAFRTRVEELGGTVEGSYVNNKTPVHLRCAEGHDCYPTPANVMGGQGICRTCAVLAPVATAEAAFRQRVAELNATVEGSYVNNKTPVHLRCAEGHDCYPHPTNILRGRGICRTCAGKDPAAAEAAFRACVADLGGTVLGAYVNSFTPVLVRCAEGHDCYPMPTNVQQGEGICRLCAGKIWDVFYVVISDFEVKFGVTSGNPRRRLGDHRRDGFRIDPPERLIEDLPGNLAENMEKAIQKTLELAGELPSRPGAREYYDISCLAIVLDQVDNYPIPELPEAA